METLDWSVQSKLFSPPCREGRRGKELFDPLRRKWVKADPEEEVRQSLLSFMIEKRAYPPALLTVEKDLKSLAHLSDQTSFPLRRADILCFAKGIHPDYPLYPLLMVECKAVPLCEKAKRQVIGYQYFVKAPFLLLANDQELLTAWQDPKTKNWEWIDGLPHYQELIDSLSS